MALPAAMDLTPTSSGRPDRGADSPGLQHRGTPCKTTQQGEQVVSPDRWVHWCDPVGFEEWGAVKDDMSRAGKKRNRLQAIFLILGAILFVGTCPSVVFIPNVAKRTDPAKIVKARADLHVLRAAAVQFRRDLGRWPASLEELLRPPPAPDGRVLEYLHRPYLDPWTAEPYRFHLLADGEPVFTSLGADLAPGGEDINADITSVEE
jgi:general secretion pathway protein G